MAQHHASLETTSAFKLPLIS